MTGHIEVYAAVGAASWAGAVMASMAQAVVGPESLVPAAVAFGCASIAAIAAWRASAWVARVNDRLDAMAKCIDDLEKKSHGD